MDFDRTKELVMFDHFFCKRPEVDKEVFKKDLERYYLPFVKKLVNIKKCKNSHSALLVGISAIQGAGKTTQGEVLEVLLSHFGFHSISRSIDDHYITHAQLSKLRQEDPRIIRRGVTHDIKLALRDLHDLQNMQANEAILVSGYDKGAHHGDGDRFRFVNLEQDLTVVIKVINEPLLIDQKTLHTQALHLEKVVYKGRELLLPDDMGSDVPLTEYLLPDKLLAFLHDHENKEVTIRESDEENVVFSADNSIIYVAKKDLPNAWRVIDKKPDFIFYDGWMLGARSVEDESVFDTNLPALETPADKQFAKDINKKLTQYETLWEMIDFMHVLYVPNYQISLTWRDQAEEVLRNKGEGMSHEQIKEFVHYFWRSVHPAIHIKNLACDTVHTDQVVIINDDHSISDLLTPEGVKTRYYIK